MSDQTMNLERYESPRIEDRQPIDFPLIGQVSGGISAAFRTDQISEE
jgi:hypothetical protein